MDGWVTWSNPPPPKHVSFSILRKPHLRRKENSGAPEKELKKKAVVFFLNALRGRPSIICANVYIDRFFCIYTCTDSICCARHHNHKKKLYGPHASGFFVLLDDLAKYIISGAWHEHPKSFQNHAPPKKKKSVKSSPPLNYTYVYIYRFFWLFLPILSGLKKKLQLQESGGSLLHQLWATKRRTKIQQAAGQVLMKFQ